ncbi:MAG: electron transfer flavoprotein subunit beta/FixA family protein [Chloroflexi bacterium]|nr:electron transfer flavoprotein subunit beta/FixA family protein [Chloroflexota bacterium]
MQVVVCVKQVPDAEGPITVDTAANNIRKGWLPDVLNPYDRLAVEEATLIKEMCGGGGVTALCMGSPSATEVLRTCLAMGADRAILLCDPALDNSDSYATGVVLAKAIAALKLPYDLILCGARAIDTNTGLTGPTIAQILRLPLVTEVVKIDVHDHEKAIVHKKLEAGNRAVIETPLPALLTVESGINTPRYLKLRAILAASMKTVEQYDLQALNLVPDEVGLAGSKTKVVSIAPPKPRGKKLFTPDSSLSAAERMRLIMSGGIAQKASSGLLEGDPRTVASRFVQFLKEKKLISGPPPGRG